MENEVIEIRQQLKPLTDSVNHLLKYSEKMDNHIQFIESTYTVARAPLDFMFSHINKFIGENIDTGVLPSLPAIDN